MISRIVNRKNPNPTIKTLYAMAYTAEADMCKLFMRSIKEEI